MGWVISDRYGTTMVPVPYHGSRGTHDTLQLGSLEEELHMYFRDPDEVATQEQKLHMLKMNDNHHVLHYINQFKEVVSLTKWNDNAHHSQFYQGLPSHLQDNIL
jgi:hypothetical protein